MKKTKQDSQKDVPFTFKADIITPEDSVKDFRERANCPRCSSLGLDEAGEYFSCQSCEALIRAFGGGRLEFWEDMKWN